MYLPSLFVILVYLSGYLFLMFAAVCLACGLYYLVELAEEYTSFTKRLIRTTIHMELVFHTLLYFYEQFPFLPTFFGTLAHLSYLNLLQTFPFIQPLSPPCLLSFLLFVISNLTYLRYFTSDNTDLFYTHRVAPLPALAAFFLIAIWLVPLAFFVSLTVNDSVLPGAGVDEPLARKKSKNLIAAAITAAKAMIGLESPQEERRGVQVQRQDLHY